MTLEIDTENLLKEKAETIKRLQKQILEFTRELHSSNKEIIELKEQIVKMKCCGNCIHCKYDENEDSYEWCEVHDQIVNIAIKPCYAYEMFDLDKVIKEIKE